MYKKNAQSCQISCDISCDIFAKRTKKLGKVWKMSENLKVLKPVEINRTKKGALKIQCSQNGGGHLRSQTRYAVAFFKAIKHRRTRFLAKNALGTFSPTPRGFSSCLHKKTTTNVVVFWRRTWDSNPRGCYTLLAFQASSLATRSILQILRLLNFVQPKHNTI